MNKRKGIVYLAGKITGDPNYREKFHDAQTKLEAAGFIVANPAIFPEGFTWEAYMRMTGAMLAECDAACFLPDWNKSEGAQREFVAATAAGKHIFFFENWAKDFATDTNVGSKLQPN